MIYTLTFSTSLDYYIDIPVFTPGEINRSSKEKFEPGGKGINVSLILKELNFESIALGFAAGFTGDELEKILVQKGIKTDFVRTAGNTRINIKINSSLESAINTTAPSINEEEISLLFQKLQKLNGGDILCIGGNVPRTLPIDIYVKIMQSLNNRNIKIIVDATGDLLLSTLPYHPFLIKPNQEELEEIMKRKLTTPEEIIESAYSLIQMGAQNVVVSLGKDGAIMVDENDNIYIKPALEGEFKSSVGAGDSLVAGFIAGYLNNGNYEDALELGIAAGTATAFSDYLSSKDKILEIFNRLIR